MKITLQTPYKEDWKFGYLVINPENRKTVILFNDKTNDDINNLQILTRNENTPQTLSTNNLPDSADFALPSRISRRNSISSSISRILSLQAFCRIYP